MISFFRYPGGKSKLRKTILDHLGPRYFKHPDLEYREPFFGGGGIGLSLQQSNSGMAGVKSRVWINDRDVGVSCLWTAVIRWPEDLKEQVMQFTPSVETFYQYKGELLTDPWKKTRREIVEWGFKKLAIHQTSYSGLGTKSGGPLGGRGQNSKYKIDCRWSPDYICKKIDKLHELFSELEMREGCCTSDDFADVIYDEQHPAILYLDPPYFVKGNDLYQYGFALEDHERLADLLRQTSHDWLLSYDDCEEIRKLYSWASMEVIGVNYTITAKKDASTGKPESRNKNELLIWRQQS